MRELLNQDRALSPGVIRTAITALGVLLGALAVVTVIYALGNLFSGRFLTALMQFAGGLGFLLAVFLIVRLLSELLFAVHRLNDRMTILGDDLKARQDAAPAAAAAKPAAKRAAPARKPAARKTTAKTPPKGESAE